MIWNAFGPIYSSIEYAYKWSDTTVAMMPNWGTITFMIFVFPFVMLVEEKGLKISAILMASLIFAGAALRAISTEDSTFLYLAHFGSILNGIAGALVMSAPSALSAVWFPANERMIATCISQSAAFMGSGFAFIVGPAMVREPNSTYVEETHEYVIANTTSVDEIKNDIRKYMLMDAMLAFIFLFLTVVYFPKQPPTPPSASATVQRTEIWTGLKELRTNKNVWLCAMAYGISGGCLLAWQGLITENFEQIEISDEQTGVIGFVIALVCSTIAFGVSFSTKYFKRRMKLTLIILLALGGLFFLWLTLICDRIISRSYAGVWISSVFGSCFVFTLTPVFFEYVAELAYPVPESLTGGFLTFFYNTFAVVLLGMQGIPDIGVIWVDYALFGSCLLGIPFVILTKETYRRLEVDSPNTSSILLENPTSSNSYQTL